MAARKKNGGDAGYAVFAEDMRSQFKVFGEALQGVRDEVKSLRAHVDQRFDVDVGLLKAAVTAHSQELREVRQEMREFRGELHDVRGELHDVREELHQVSLTVTRVEGALATKVDRGELDARITQAQSGR